MALRSRHKSHCHVASFLPWAFQASLGEHRMKQAFSVCLTCEGQPAFQDPLCWLRERVLTRAAPQVLVREGCLEEAQRHAQSLSFSARWPGCGYGSDQDSLPVTFPQEIPWKLALSPSKLSSTWKMPQSRQLLLCWPHRLSISEPAGSPAQ